MTASAPPAARSLLLPQIRFENRLFWRTPIAAFFTLIFPLMFLLLFSVIFGENDTIDLGPRGVFTIAQFYAPALGVFGVASATYTNVGTSTALARDEGILKRFLGTPLPAWAYLVGKIGSAIWVGLLAMVLMMTIGAVVFDVPIYPGRLPAAAVTFLLGALSFAMLGLMVAALAPSGDSAPPRRSPTPPCCRSRLSPRSSSSRRTVPDGWRSSGTCSPSSTLCVPSKTPSARL